MKTSSKLNETSGRPGCAVACTSALTCFMLCHQLRNRCAACCDSMLPCNQLSLHPSMSCLCAACKAMGASGCTSASTGATACCAGQGLACVIPRGKRTGTCMKPPTLAARPVTGVSTKIVNGVITATVKLASTPVSNNNGGGVYAACMHSQVFVLRHCWAAGSLQLQTRLTRQYGLQTLTLVVQLSPTTRPCSSRMGGPPHCTLWRLLLGCAARAVGNNKRPNGALSSTQCASPRTYRRP